MCNFAIALGAVAGDPPSRLSDQFASLIGGRQHRGRTRRQARKLLKEQHTGLPRSGAGMAQVDRWLSDFLLSLNEE